MEFETKNGNWINITTIGPNGLDKRLGESIMVSKFKGKKGRAYVGELGFSSRKDRYYIKHYVEGKIKIKDGNHIMDSNLRTYLFIDGTE